MIWKCQMFRSIDSYSAQLPVEGVACLVPERTLCFHNRGSKKIYIQDMATFKKNVCALFFKVIHVNGMTILFQRIC
jgi:hypothetical protein